MKAPTKTAFERHLNDSPVPTYEYRRIKYSLNYGTWLRANDGELFEVRYRKWLTALDAQKIIVRKDGKG